MNGNIQRTSERTFYGVSVLLFALSAAVTIAWCGSMNAMDAPAMTGMEMPGNWTMSMTWMRMPDQSWPRAAVSFLGMWLVMMVAMMLPALVPMLKRYRRGLATHGAHLDRLTAVAGLGYFCVWMLSGVVAYPFGVALAALAMHWPALARLVPPAAGLIVMIAGVLQLSAWKSRQLDCCRRSTGRGEVLRADVRTAWNQGLQLGIRCNYCCAGLTATLLVSGVMDLRAMAMVTAAISLERLAPRGARHARGIGAALIATGLVVIVRAFPS